MTPLTLKGSGITVNIKKVSPLLVLQLRRDFPPPRPPMNEVDYGDGRKVWEENAADPRYLAALQDYENESEQRLRRLIMLRGVDVAVDHEAVQELRDFWLDEYGGMLPADDKEVYLSYIVVGDDQDLEDLITAVLRRSQPTAETINQAVQTFQTQVPR